MFQSIVVFVLFILFILWPEEWPISTIDEKWCGTAAYLKKKLVEQIFQIG